MAIQVKIEKEGNRASASISENMKYLSARYPNTPPPELGLCLLEVVMDQLPDYDFVGLEEGDRYVFDKE